MTRTLRLGAVLLLAAGLQAGDGGDKPVPSVTYAPSWADALKEGQILSVPIVVHHHGFY